MAIRGHESDDLPPTGKVVDVVNPAGAGGFVLVCEHASHFIPPELEDLGLSGDALLSHIAWDPGALAVAKVLSAVLDVPLVVPQISRLVYDCNRPPEAQSAMPAESEIYKIPGNAGLCAADRAARVEQFYEPFRDTLAATLQRSLSAGKEPILVTVHSFTPVYKGERRDLDLGILHDADARLADELLKLIGMEGELAARRNSPYGPQDGVTHTLSEHGVARGLPNVMIEIRNDLIRDAAGQQAMAARLANYLVAARAALADR